MEYDQEHVIAFVYGWWRLRQHLAAMGEIPRDLKGRLSQQAVR